MAELFPNALPRPAEGADVAYTPDHVARACVSLVGDLRGAVVWEMHAGGGAWLQPLLDAGATVIASEADPAAVALLVERFPGVTVYPKPWDALRGLPPGLPTPDYIAGNPPWSEAAKHLIVALDTARLGVGWVLPWAWLVPAARSWVSEDAFIDELFPLVERAEYTGPGREGQGSPPRDSALHIWRKRAGSWMGRGLIGRVSTETGRVWRGVSNG